MHTAIAKFRQSLDSVQTWAMYIIIEVPIDYMYRNGPAIGPYGCWGGIDSADVCAGLSTVPAYHWADNPIECDLLIKRRILSWCVLVTTCIYVYTIARMYVCLLDRACRHVRHAPE